MTAPDPNLARRVRQMERQIAKLEHRLLTQSMSSGAFDVANLRIAKTVERSSSYPTTSANTFWIRFLDGYFSLSGGAGAKTPTWDERTDEGDTDDADDVLAHSLGGFIPEGTIVTALWQRGTVDPSANGEWWILPVRGGGCPARVTSASITARSGTTVGSGTVTRYYRSTSTLTSLETSVTVYSDYATAIAQDTYITIMQDALGDWWVVGADC